MTREDQKKFVRELSLVVVEEICVLIERGKIPEGWDGHELRCLLSERHADSATMTVIMGEPRRRRARGYREIVERI